MCPGLRPVVDAEHRDDDAVELRRNAQLARAVPMLHQPPGRRVGAGHAAQGAAEDGGDSGSRSGDLHPARGLVNGVDAQPCIGQHCADRVDVAAVRAVAGTEMGVADRVRSLDQAGWHGRPAAQHHRQLDDLPRINPAVRGRLRAARYEDVSYAEIKDPFDRIIVATAWVAAILLVTADGAINRLGGQSESSATAAKARRPRALADGWSDGVRAGEWAS